MRIISMLSALLVSCSTIPDDYWVNVRGPSHSVRVHYVDMSVLTEKCQNAGAIGCAVLQEESVCDVYIWYPRRGDDCVLSHELRHCAGWSHPRYPYTIAINVCGRGHS